MGVRTGTGGRHHRRVTVLEQQDRRPLEGDEASQLGDEGAERLVELEGRAERPSAAIGRFEQVDAPTELVPEALGLLGTIPRERCLLALHLDEPADDDPEHGADGDPKHDRFRLDLEPELARAPYLGEGEDRDPDQRGDESPHEAVEERRLEDDQEEQRPERLARLERVDEDQGGREQQVEGDPGHRDDPSSNPVRKGEDDQHEGAKDVEAENRPRRRFVARGEGATGVEELDQRQRHDQEPHEREQLDDPHSPRSVSRASDHSACSLRRSSSPPANRSRTGRCSAPPTLPATRSAFLRR